MVTDIAFTLELVALLGRRGPLALTAFVSALAVTDDLGAIVVVATEAFDEEALAAIELAARVASTLSAATGMTVPWRAARTRRGGAAGGEARRDGGGRVPFDRERMTAHSGSAILHR